MPLPKSSRIPSFRWVLQGKLAASAMPLSVPDIADSGINVVVSLVPKKGIQFRQSMSFRDKLKSLGISFTNIPVREHKPPTGKQFSSFLQIMALAEKNPNARVLVHCDKGLGRTGTMIAGYLIAKKGYSLEAAYGEIRSGLLGVCQDTALANPRLLSRLREKGISISDFVELNFHFPETIEQELFLKSIRPRRENQPILNRAEKARARILARRIRKKPI
ncbi:MAG: dual specificity protein phosphatase family protein [Candidatus ainarchaeum sp.]|nr:dual specificity protein phosphatase family protein [Candidatus ainarchaeum sp.]